MYDEILAPCIAILLGNCMTIIEVLVDIHGWGRGWGSIQKFAMGH